MSSGKTHLKASLTLSAGFAIGAMVSLDPRVLTCSAGAMAGVLLTPDLDVDKAYIGDKIIEERVGWFGKGVWMWFWKPYKTSFKHGQFASHFPIFGTLVRVFYIYFMLILPFYLIYFLILHSSNYYPWLRSELEYWGRMFTNQLFLYDLI